MKRFLIPTMAGILTLTLSCKSAAHQAPPSSDLAGVRTGPAWSHLTPGDFTMAPPPAANSEAFRKDFEELLADQDSRTEEDCKAGRRMQYPSFKSLFNPSPVLSDDEFKKDQTLFETVMDTTERISNHFKGVYGRPRPYVTNPDIKPCVPLISGNKSYPSSHSAMAVAATCLIAKQFPDRADEAEKYGQYLAELRVKIGVHHPSDVTAGMKLGQDVCERLLSDERFMRDFKTIRQN